MCDSWMQARHVKIHRRKSKTKDQQQWKSSLYLKAFSLNANYFKRIHWKPVWMCLHVDLQTGSLVFQCLPIIADAMPTEGCFNVKTTQANTRNHHIPGHILYSGDAVHGQKKTTQSKELIYSKCMKQTSFMTCKTQSSKKFRTLKKENKENLYCLSYHKLWVVFGLSTLFFKSD